MFAADKELWLYSLHARYRVIRNESNLVHHIWIVSFYIVCIASNKTSNLAIAIEVRTKKLVAEFICVYMQFSCHSIIFDTYIELESERSKTGTQNRHRYIDIDGLNGVTDATSPGCTVAAHAVNQCLQTKQASQWRRVLSAWWLVLGLQSFFSWFMTLRTVHCLIYGTCYSNSCSGWVVLGCWWRGVGYMVLTVGRICRYAL